VRRTGSATMQVYVTLIVVDTVGPSRLSKRSLRCRFRWQYVSYRLHRLALSQSSPDCWNTHIVTDYIYSSFTSILRIGLQISATLSSLLSNPLCECAFTIGYTVILLISSIVVVYLFPWYQRLYHVGLYALEFTRYGTSGSAIDLYSAPNDTYNRVILSRPCSHCTIV